MSSTTPSPSKRPPLHQASSPASNKSSFRRGDQEIEALRQQGTGSMHSVSSPSHSLRGSSSIGGGAESPLGGSLRRSGSINARTKEKSDLTKEKLDLEKRRGRVSVLSMTSRSPSSSNAKPKTDASSSDTPLHQGDEQTQERKDELVDDADFGQLEHSHAAILPAEEEQTRNVEGEESEENAAGTTKNKSDHRPAPMESIVRFDSKTRMGNESHSSPTGTASPTFGGSSSRRSGSRRGGRNRLDNSYSSAHLSGSYTGGGGAESFRATRGSSEGPGSPLAGSPTSGAFQQQQPKKVLKSWQLKSFALIPPDAFVGRFPLVYVLGQVAQDEEKRRETLFEKQLVLADDLYMQLLKERKEIDNEVRRRRLAADNEARLIKAEKERQLALRRRLFKDQDLEREIIRRIEQRAFEDILRQDIQERQRAQTLERVSRRKKQLQEAAPENILGVGGGGGDSSRGNTSLTIHTTKVNNNNSGALGGVNSSHLLGDPTVAKPTGFVANPKYTHMLDTVRANREEPSKLEETNYDDDDSEEEEDGATTEHNSTTQNRSPSTKRTIGPKGVSRTAMDFYLSSPMAEVYMQYAEDGKGQLSTLRALREEMKSEKKKKRKEEESATENRRLSRTQAAEDASQAEMAKKRARKDEKKRKERATLVLQKAGRGFFGRLDAAAEFLLRLHELANERTASSSRPPSAHHVQGRPPSALKRPGSGARSRPQSAVSVTMIDESPLDRSPAGMSPGGGDGRASILATPYSGSSLVPPSQVSRQGLRRSSTKSTTPKKDSPAEHLRERSDHLLKKIRQQRKRLFPQLTQQRDFDDLYHDQEARLRDKEEAKNRNRALDAEMEEAHAAFQLPKHVTIYDPFKTTAIRKELKEGREKRLKDIRDESWHSQNRVRLEMTEKLEQARLQEDMQRQRERYKARKREKEMRDRREREMQAKRDEQRRLYVMRDKHDVEALELHIALREEFLKESHVSALQHAIVKVPGADRIAAMTTNLSVEKVKRADTMASLSGSMRSKSQQGHHYHNGKGGGGGAILSRAQTPSERLSSTQNSHHHNRTY